MTLLKSNRAFRIMITAQLFNNLGTSLFNIVFLMIAASRPHATLAVTAVAFITFLPDLFAILLGNLADKTHDHLLAWSITRRTYPSHYFSGDVRLTVCL